MAGQKNGNTSVFGFLRHEMLLHPPPFISRLSQKSSWALAFQPFLQHTLARVGSSAGT
jgi:hypothetical protein